MKKLNLAKAVELCRKNADKRNVRRYESEVADRIDEEIRLCERDIEDKTKDLAKMKVEKEEEFIDSLTIVCDDNIKTVKGRKSEAVSYMERAITAARENKAYIEVIQDKIEALKDTIKDLKEFRATLETLDQKIKIEAEEE